MKKSLCFFGLFFCAISSSIACLSAYQFKVFPVGVIHNYIVTLDVQIHRSEETAATARFAPWGRSGGEWTPMWTLRTFISVYDWQQKPLLTLPAGTECAIDRPYGTKLAQAYTKAFTAIVQRYPAITLFKPDYLSFCDFQRKGEKVSLLADTLTHSTCLVYENKRYSVPAFHDTTYYGLSRSEEPIIESFALSSVRVYTAGKIQLVLAHLASGQDLGKADRTEEGDIVLAREYKPAFPFSDIRRATYEEPLLHHGYGVDLFIVKEK